VCDILQFLLKVLFGIPMWYLEVSNNRVQGDIEESLRNLEEMIRRRKNE